jgi:D-aminopeptidase
MWQSNVPVRITPSLMRCQSARGWMLTTIILGVMLATPERSAAGEAMRPRAREVGVIVGVLDPGPLNTITDVTGVEVGQVTRIEGEDVRTGVTVILPHPGNIFRDKVPGAIVVGNGFGKLIGSSQVNELGEIESPIALTSTLNAPRAADALLDYLLELPGNEDVRSANPLVGETNDGVLNDVRGRHVTHDDVLQAIRSANTGRVEEGTVGAGTGTIAFGFKGGIGTASRRLPASLGGYTVGVLVQSNYGGVLSIVGAPVGVELGRYYLKDQLRAPTDGSGTGLPAKASRRECSKCLEDKSSADGSIMIVVATDAPLDSRNLRRLAFRALFGLARTGGSGAGESGDYVIAFSTAQDLRIRSDKRLHPSTTTDPTVAAVSTRVLPNDVMSPLFLAVIEATEEAIYNSLFRATTVTGRGHTAESLPIEATLNILRRHGLLQQKQAIH